MKNQSNLSPELTRQLSTADGFTNRWYALLRIYRTHAEAYEAVENEYSEIFGRRRYSCFDSFRIVRNRKIKKN